MWQKLCVAENIYSHKLWSNWYIQWHVLCDRVWQWSSYMSCHVRASSIQQNVIVCVCVCVCVLFVGVFSYLPSWGCWVCGTTTSSVLKVMPSCHTIRWECCTLLLPDIASEEWLIFCLFCSICIVLLRTFNRYSMPAMNMRVCTELAFYDFTSPLPTVFFLLLFLFLSSPSCAGWHGVQW